MAQKTLRQELSAEFRQYCERLDNLDTQDFNFRLEKEATAFEEALLKLVADILEQNVRDGQYLARMGGNEFIVVLEGADSDAGARWVERLRS